MLDCMYSIADAACRYYRLFENWDEYDYWCNMRWEIQNTPDPNQGATK